MNNRRPWIQAFLAAALFGASAPLAKALLGQIEPIPMAALLYLGCGAGAWLLHRFQPGTAESRLQRHDLPWLIGALLAGGFAAPIILLFGLQATPAATAALLLNFESVATTLLAVFAFREAAGRRLWGAVGAITVSSILLSWAAPGQPWGLAPGALAILGACFLWGLDNNLTRVISSRDPLTIVTIKGLGAGSCSLLLALALQQPLPALLPALGALLLGSLSYGLSLFLFVRALRELGAARTGAVFGTAPFLGALLALTLFRDPLTIPFLLAVPFTALGTWLLVTEDHHHAHTHIAVEHDHRHRHDDLHHDHDHTPDELPAQGQFHSHPHSHPEQTHDHNHTPDIHHRHAHES